MGLVVPPSDVVVKAREGKRKLPRRFSCVVDLVAPLCRFFSISCVWKVTFEDEGFLANSFDEFFVASSGKETTASFCSFWRKPSAFVSLSALCLRFEPWLPSIEGRKDCSWSSELEYKTILRDNENIRWTSAKFLWRKKYLCSVYIKRLLREKRT